MAGGFMPRRARRGPMGPMGMGGPFGMGGPMGGMAFSMGGFGGPTIFFSEPWAGALHERMCCVCG